MSQPDMINRDIVDTLGFGVMPNLFKAADVNHDVLTAMWQAFKHLMLEGVLPRTLKEMMGMVVSREANSAYAAQLPLHAFNFQVDINLLDGLCDSKPHNVPERTAALLQFAQRAAKEPDKSEHAAFLAEQGFCEKEIAEAVCVVGLFRMLNTWADLLAIPVDTP